MQRVVRRGRRGICAGFRVSVLSSLHTYCPAPSVNSVIETSIHSPPVRKLQRSDRCRTQRMALRIDSHLLRPPQGLEHLRHATNVENVPIIRGSISSKMQKLIARKMENYLTDEEPSKVSMIGRSAVSNSVVNCLRDPIPESSVLDAPGPSPILDSLMDGDSEIICNETGEVSGLSTSDYWRENLNEKPLDVSHPGKPNMPTSSLCAEFSALGTLDHAWSPEVKMGTTAPITEIGRSCSKAVVASATQHSRAGEGRFTIWSKHGVNLFMDDFSPAHLNRGAPRPIWKKLECSSSRGACSTEPQTSDFTLAQHSINSTTKRPIPFAVSKGEGETEVVTSTMEREESLCAIDFLERVEKLRQVIADYAYRYHTLDSPVISDAAYDALVRELKVLESRLPTEATQESVTAKVGAPPSSSMKKVRHVVPMLSLAAVNKEDELRVWHEHLQQRLNQILSGAHPLEEAWVVEPKVDGLALSLRYEEGKLVCAATRGDGYQGEDVTHNARNITGIPHTLLEHRFATGDQVPVLEVRGEVYMKLQDFHELNAVKVKAGEKPFANPRNAAAGSMRLLQTRHAEQRHLSFMAYAIVPAGKPEDPGVDSSPQLVKTQWAALNLLKQLGFAVNNDNGRFDSFDAAQHYATRWRDSRSSLKYESDGVVFKIDDLMIQAALGAIGSDPRWAVAWKFAATEVVTVLEAIELSIGRSGSLIPTARLKPVGLGGVTISRALLHNFGLVERLGICEGDHVVVQRAGDVIPQVVQVLQSLRQEHAHLWVPPERCPYCDGKLTSCKDKHITSCCNTKCPGRHSRQIEHFAKALIRGLGPSILNQIQDEGLVADPADFYALSAETLSNLDGLGKKSAVKLVKAIEESKEKTLGELMAALGIPSVGSGAAKLLAKCFGSLNRLLLASEEELLLVPGVGKVSAAAILDWCTNQVNVQLVSRLAEAGFSPTVKDADIEKFMKDRASSTPGLKPKKSSKAQVRKLRNVSVKESAPELLSSSEGSGSKQSNNGMVVDETKEVAEQHSLHGKIVVVTGEFEDFTREELEEVVLSNGGQLRKSVSSKTSFIVAGQFPGPTKVAKASQLGIPVYDLPSFQELLQQSVAPISDEQSLAGATVQRAMSG